ncbi:ABC transporter permease [Clostridiales bacterium COT073_COT-073]|nr:ABC transporter permease [Clostridiales bacterium COT073_COT-073]
MNLEKKFEMIRTLTAVVISLLVGFLIILLVGREPVQTIFYFVLGPVTKFRYLGNVIELAIPLIFSGLATALLFTSGLFNLGSEGIFYFGGLLAAIVGITLRLPSFIHPLVGILTSALAGMAVMAVIGFFKARYNASELVISLMFNSILYGVGLYILNYNFRDPSVSGFASLKLQTTALLTNIIPRTRIHSGLLLALAMAGFCHVFLYHTKWGYEIRMQGLNFKFAEYAGMKPAKIILLTSLLAGALAGMGGAVEISGMYERFRWAALPGLGFDGALIAMLAKNKPLNVIGAAVFLAYIRIGADLMARMTDIPSEMIYILQAVIILLISGRRFLENYRQRALIREVEKNG